MDESFFGDLDGDTSAAMRVLVADSDFAAPACAFEVALATSKASCIDLLRANDFDVLVAAERLADGSGLELLSQVAKRWPSVVRILAIRPERRALLKGKLAPFKLFDTIPYPIDAALLEGALGRAAEFCKPDAPAAREPEASRVTGARARLPKSKGIYSNAVARNPSTSAWPVSAAPPRASTQVPKPPLPRAATPAPKPPLPRAQPVRPRASANPDASPPLPSRASMRDYVPLGTPDTQSVTILPRDYPEGGDEHPLIARLERTQEKAQPAPPSKAASLAAAVQAAVKNYIKPAPASPPPPRNRRKPR